MPEQLPKKIFNLISDRSTQLKSVDAHTLKRFRLFLVKFQRIF